jgi:GWxTD domain-containing protein
MKKILLFLLLPLFSWAQFQFIPVSVDYATFFSTDTTAYIEIYLSFFQGNLQYVPLEDGTLGSSFTNKIEISGDNSFHKEASHNYKNTKNTGDSQFNRYNQFVDIFCLELPYGTYKVKAEILDNNSKLKGEYILDLSTIKPQEQLFLSDIEFCSQIVRDTSKTMFYKNNLKVVPHPRSVFDMLQPMLYYYVELNNLSYSPDEQRFYEFEYFITTSEGDTIRKMPPKKKEIFASTLVEAGGLNVIALPKNVYFFNAKAVDLKSGSIAVKRNKFSVFKPSKKDSISTETKLPEIAQVYSNFSKEDLITEFKMAQYIASSQEEKVFKNLENAEAMKKFLTEFWRRQDKSANLTSGASRKRYMRLVEYANSHFSFLGRKGWKTDRGRVKMIYGEPSEIERYPSSIDILPYTIWHYYNLEGGAIFIFSDLNGFGEYELIHSTYRKELQNPSWQSLINKGRGAGQDRGY